MNVAAAWSTEWEAAHAGAADDLDAVRPLFAEGRVAEAMARVQRALRARRTGAPPEAWARVAVSLGHTHPIARILHQEPLTWHAFRRPRGYAGDAALLDLIFGEAAVPDTTTALGRAIHASILAAPVCASLRRRRALVQEAIDATARRTGAAGRYLAFGGGHLREAQGSRPFRDRALDTFYAVDADPRAVSRVARIHAVPGLQAMDGGVRELLRGALRVGEVDLAYAAGPYDALEQPLAGQVTAALFATLRAGGRLLVTNLCAELSDAAYLESFMGWTPRYRDEADMRGLVAALPAHAVASARVFRDEGQHMIYLEVTRV